MSRTEKESSDARETICPNCGNHDDIYVRSDGRLVCTEAEVRAALDAMSRTVLLDFFVPGDPAPQGSKRYLGPGKVVESSKRVAPWRADIRRAAEAAMKPRHEALWAAPVYVELDFYLSRPKSHYGTGRNAQRIKESAPNWPGRPDVDKLARAVLDALTGLVIADDSTVVELRASKSYGRRPGVNVLIEEMGW